jgi:hypothetical protein
MHFRSAAGIWKVQEEDNNWIINLDFPDHFRATVHLRHQKPPHQIHIMMGDPDTWHAMLLEKRSQSEYAIEKD